MSLLKVKFFIIGIIGVILITLLTQFPFIYNHYIFPLGRLHQELSIGMNYEVVSQKFETYYQQHNIENNEIYFNRGLENTAIKECKAISPYY
jgi:hypothetical protein